MGNGIGRVIVLFGGPVVAHRVFHRAAVEMERDWLPRYSRILTTSEPDAQRARQ